MDAAPSTAPAAVVPPREPPHSVPAWPRAAQAATLFLLGVASTLLVVHGCRGLRWGSRPTELERGVLAPYQIDLNRADLTELLQVPGLGDSLAGRIVAYRRQHGPFASMNDLCRVNGIGPTTLERLRTWLHVQEQDTDRSAEPYPRISPPRSMQATRSAESEGSRQSRKPAGKKETQLAEPIDLNRATETELQRLPGIGPRRARLIIGEREKRPFASLEELRRVPGIGPKTLEKLRPHIMVQPAPLRTPRQVNPELRSERSVEELEVREKQRST